MKRKLTELELKKLYGFTKSNKKAKYSAWQIFKLIPITPKTITKKELCEKVKCTSTELGSAFRGMPSKAPFFEIDKHTISRFK